MKYMTKAWYDTMQKTEFHLFLKVSKKAEVFSEAYFKSLYEKEEKIWLKYQEDLSSLKLEDIFPEEFEAAYVDGYPLDPAEYEEEKKEYMEMREQIRAEHENRPPFDPELEKRNFRKGFRYDVKHLEENLPEAILKKVADLRVLALHRASAQVKKEITAYCKANEKIVQTTLKAYRKEYRSVFKDGEPDFEADFRFHDCKVVSCRRRGRDLVVTIDNSGGFTSIRQVIFRDCSVLRQDERLHGAWWLYDEIYKEGDGYDIHVLLQKKEALIDLIVNVSGVAYR